MNKIKTTIKVVKIALGSTIAILAAYALGLDYAVSAGIITLLSVQDTKKATVSVALKRAISFAMATLIAYVAFSVFDYRPGTFGLFLLVFTGLCFATHLQEGIAMSAVLSTHYLLEQDMSLAIIGNESLLLLIGAGIGIVLNLYMPSNRKQIRSEQLTIEGDLKSILTQMADRIEGKCTIDNDQLQFVQLKTHIDTGLSHAYTNMNNSFFQETRYYIQYMEMRNQQYGVLKEISERIQGLTTVTRQAYEVAEFVRKISVTLSESENAKGLLKMEAELLEKFKESPQPVTREEFENRAILYVLLMDFRLFLKMKEAFADALTQEQKDRYWRQE